MEYNVIPTQPKSTLKKERVRFYQKRIRENKFPIILALTIHGDELFIIDGHHKFAAYKILQIYNPVIISIQPITGKEIIPVKNLGDYLFYCLNFCTWENPKTFVENSEEISAVGSVHHSLYLECFREFVRYFEAGNKIPKFRLTESDWIFPIIYHTVPSSTTRLDPQQLLPVSSADKVQYDPDEGDVMEEFLLDDEDDEGSQDEHQE